MYILSGGSVVKACVSRRAKPPRVAAAYLR